MTHEELKEARLALGLTQSQLAEWLGLGTDGGRAVRRYEGGDRRISGPISRLMQAYLDGWRYDED